jgi:hypothetical protein
VAVHNFDEPVGDPAHTVTVVPSSPLPEYVVDTPAPRCVPLTGALTTGAAGAVVSSTNGTAPLESEATCGNPFGPTCDAEIVYRPSPEPPLNMHAQRPEPSARNEQWEPFDTVAVT